MVAGSIRREAECDLRELLATMNSRPGVANPANQLLPFGDFPQLHVARFVILQDDTLGDRAAYHSELVNAPLWLAFLGDCDGDGESMLAALAGRCARGLRYIFACCEDFDQDADLLGWMLARRASPAAHYVNWVGRTVQQIREEAALHAALRHWLAEPGISRIAPAGEIRRNLAARRRAQGPPLTAPGPTPVGWLARHLANLFGVPLALLPLLPVLIIGAPFFLTALRSHEKRDPEITPRPDPEHLARLTAIEDFAVSNQFSAFGSVKPGLFREFTLRTVFWLLDFSTRHLYTRGRLARIGTIHFARWVFLDGRRRMLFASNYDGSLDSYMDDFINKVAYGLNLVFSNGIGYPKTSWLLFGGAKNELPFKNFLRRHQVPTQVWYKAYPNLTAADLAANTQIREGLLRPSMSEAEARAWLALI
jgi:hypothetical protein